MAKNVPDTVKKTYFRLGLITNFHDKDYLIDNRTICNLDIFISFQPLTKRVGALPYDKFKLNKIYHSASNEPTKIVNRRGGFIKRGEPY